METRRTGHLSLTRSFPLSRRQARHVGTAPTPPPPLSRRRALLPYVVLRPRPRPWAAERTLLPPDLPLSRQIMERQLVNSHRWFFY